MTALHPSPPRCTTLAECRVGDWEDSRFVREWILRDGIQRYQPLQLGERGRSPFDEGRFDYSRPIWGIQALPVSTLHGSRVARGLEASRLANAPAPKGRVPGTELDATDYYAADSPWVEGGFCWLECHQGNLWLLCPSSGRLSFPLCHWSFASFCLLTRGPWKGREERVELFLASDLATAGTSLTLRPWQCNRLPGWQPGKRCWRLHVVAGSLDRPGEFELVFWRTVFWRSAELPCLEPWQGPRPDGLFRSSPFPQMTREENDGWWCRIHELNGTYRNKKPKHLHEGWFESLKRQYRPEDPMGY